MNWHEICDLVIKYFEHYGSLCMPINFKTINGIDEDSKGVNIYKWLLRQRESYRRNTLSKEKREILESLDKNFLIIDTRWYRVFTALKNRYQTYGSIKCPYSFKTSNGIDEDKEYGIYLGRWISRQREDYHKGILQDYKMELLNSVGMVWEVLNNKDILNICSTYEIDYDKNEQVLTRISKKNFEALLFYLNEINEPYLINDMLSPIFTMSSEQIKEKYNVTLQDIKTKYKLHKKSNSMEETLYKKWLYKYELTKKYYEEHGNLNVPKKYEVNGVKLGEWLVTQRSNYREKKLSKQKIELLTEIGFKPPRVTFSWFDVYDLVKEYLKDKEEKVVPKYTVVKKIDIGIWLTNQRSLWRRGKLSEDKVKLLQQIGISLKCKDSEDIWLEKYNLAKKYYEEHGNLDMPSNYVINNIDIGAWLDNQKLYYHSHKLKEEHLNLLLEIGFNCHHRMHWLDYYKLVKDYYEEHKDLNIRRDYVTESGSKLGVWLNKQRKLYTKNELDDTKIKLLEKLNITWEIPNNSNDKKWDEGYMHAREYYIQNGDLNVAKHYISSDGFKLGNWLSLQQQYYHSHLLTDLEIFMLDEIGMIWLNNRSIKYIVKICESYGIDFDKNIKVLSTISRNELLAKIAFLEYHYINLTTDDVLHPIFSMSSIDMKNNFGYTLEELIQEYFGNRKESKDNNVYKKVRK